MKFKIGDAVVTQPYKMSRRPKYIIIGIENGGYVIRLHEDERPEGLPVTDEYIWFREEDLMSYEKYLHEDNNDK